MKVLVTGGLGYIGSHTVVTLLESGYDVVIIDDLSNSRMTVLDGIEKITGKRPLLYRFDLSSANDLKDCLEQENEIDGIIHFAARKYVGESVRLPLLYYRINLLSLINLLEAMPQYGIRNFVFSSSCTVYGDSKNSPIREDEPVKPAASPYGNTKQIGEEIIKDTIKAHPGLCAIALRYFNPIGAHPSAEIGELALGKPENLLPNLILSARGKIPELKVFGDDYDTVDGTAVRDYIHVVDLAAAHLRALERMKGESGGNYRYYNIGTGKGSSVLEMIQTFEQVTGRKLDYRMAPRREGDVEKIWADPALAEKELNWNAKLSLKDMIASHWAWEMKRSI